MYEIVLNGSYQIQSLLAHNLKVVPEISMCVTVVMEECHLFHFCCPLLSSKALTQLSECFLEPAKNETSLKERNLNVTLVSWRMKAINLSLS